MSEQETKEPLIPEEAPKDRPCIFGEDIHRSCPVRKDISSNKDPEINKWIKPSNKMLDEAAHLIDMFTDALSQQYGTLAEFCNVCPFLAIFINNKTP